MKMLALPVFALAACSFETNNAGGDGGMDGKPFDAPPGCFGSSPDDVVCLSSTPVAQVMLAGPVLTSPGAPQCSTLVTSGPSACVIAGTSIVVQGTVNVSGTRPLVLISTGTVTITGLLDASSHNGAQVGPGANPGACTTAAAPSGGGGGAGGSFAAQGGIGGMDAEGMAGGTAGATTTATKIRGGCAGGTGGNGALGGNGGGGVLIVASRVQIDGAIDVSGAGGDGGAISFTMPTGGGGGGTGGMIAIDAPTIAGAGTIFANGGGGGGGGGDGTGGGRPGGDPSAASATTGGGGGSGAVGAGNGGGGAAATTHTGSNGGSGGSGGGGGGGGAVGIVRFYAAQLLGGTISPS